MNISNLRIGVRLSLGFAAVGILLATVAGIGITRLAKLNDGTNLIVADRYPKTSQLHAINVEVNKTARAMRNMLLAPDADVAKAEAKRITDARNVIAQQLSQLQAHVHSEKGIELLKTVSVAGEQYVATQNKFIQLVSEDKKDEARDMLFGELRKAQNTYFDALDKSIEYQSGLMAQAGIDAQADYLMARNLMLGLTAVALAISGLIAIFATRSITRPMSEAVHFAQTVAAGDLSKSIEVRHQDETGQLLRALQEMNANLGQIVSQVRTGTDTIACASTEIANGNLDLSSRTEEQASSLEETASSMEELASTVRQNTENAKQANHMARTASEIAERGGKVVSEVVQTMSSINESSRKIVDIISVIDGIAFQTNILALNAAVEAARAGEQGRGFAVVAAEVRTLAQRSASAAKEIKTLIGDSVERVDAGSRLVDKAGETMAEVVASVKQVTTMMSNISEASLEQNAGIDQINQAVTQMDTVTQQNAALVEEAAAAAQALKDQASTLSALVSKFKISMNDAPAMAKNALRQGNHTLKKVGASVGVPVAIANSANKTEWEEF